MRKVTTGAVVLVLAFIFTNLQAVAEEPWQVARRIADFGRLDLMPPDAAHAVRKAGELKVEGTCVTGRAECDVQVPQTGWYELMAEPDGGNNEFVIDGKLSVWATGRTKPGGNGKLVKVDNLWLAKGPHTIRVQRYIWWGFFPPIRGIVLRQSDGALGKTVRVEYPHGPGEALVRKGDDLRMIVHSAGRAQAATLTVQLKDKKQGQVDSAVTVDLPAGQEPRAIPVALPCKTEGAFRVHFADGPAAIATSDLAPMTVHVVDVTPVRREGGELKQTLLQEIDCAAKAPDYVSGGDAKVVTTAAGKYRLSGDGGFLYAQHHNQKGSWFAYKIDTPDVGKPHVLEVTYPDDDRTFLIVIRENSTDDYPVAGGVDSGGPWALSNKMLTQSILFWPKTAAPRVLFVPAHNGLRAGAASIRVYRVDGEIPALDVSATGGRTFLNWYEEGSNFTGFYGGTKGGIDAYLKSAEMWPRELAYMGGNMIVPTVAIYQMSMYPSRYNHHHHAEMPTPDVLRLLLLKAEKFGLTVVPEFHPEARELGRESRQPTMQELLCQRAGRLRRSWSEDRPRPCDREKPHWPRWLARKSKALESAGKAHGARRRWRERAKDRA